MQQDILDQLFAIVKDKYEVNLTQCKNQPESEYFQKYTTGEFYFDLIEDEVSEAKKELKKDNSVYLEDELSDILWNYLSLLYCLGEEWYISKEQVFERCLKKFSERTEWIQAWVLWNKIKEKQKQELLDEHNKKYS